MAREEREEIVKLEQIDLSKVTLEDLKRLRNPSLREALLDLVRLPDDVLALGHQNHGSHSNHTTESAEFLDLQFKADRSARPE